MIEKLVNEIGVASIQASSYFASVDMPPMDFSNLKGYAPYALVTAGLLVAGLGYALAVGAGKNRDRDEE